MNFNCSYLDEFKEYYEKEKELLDVLMARFSKLVNNDCKMDEYMAVRIDKEEIYYDIISKLLNKNMLLSFLNEYNMHLAAPVCKNARIFNYKLDCCYVAIKVGDYYKLINIKEKTKRKKDSNNSWYFV